ncbi:MAG: flagellar type III secretion system pore protein FliP [Planctomycetes bacterium]|nr:flagellar type III secretion system pore protein FliP [Planctomycetota bacterium]MBI3843058.1 flagellar type III secretion system pore protein FliP [Planctomycetota bacterium]
MIRARSLLRLLVAAWIAVAPIGAASFAQVPGDEPRAAADLVAGASDANGAAPASPKDDRSTQQGSASSVPARDPLSLPLQVSFGGDGSNGTSNAVKIVLLLTAISLAPAAILSVTCFTRIIIVLSLLRRAISVQEIPPNPVLIGLALFVTAAVMSPVIADVHANAMKPFLENQIGAEEAGNRAAHSLSGFLIKQTREDDIALFAHIAKIDRPKSTDALPLRVLVPAFLVSELKTAFQMGFVLFLPFLVIDLVVSSILLSMGMFMLPPVLISTPFKLLLFVLVDGWHLVIQSLAMSFR